MGVSVWGDTIMQYEIELGVLIGLLAIMPMLPLLLKRRRKQQRSARFYIAQNGSGSDSAGLEGLSGVVGKSSDIKQEGLAPSSSFAAPSTWIPTSKFTEHSHQTGAA